MKVARIWWTVLLMLSLSPHVQSQDFSLIGNIEGGYSRLSTDVATELDKNGFQFGLSAGGSFNSSIAVFDANFGWFYNRMKGSSSGPISSETVITRVPYFEFVPRFKIVGPLEVGPLARALVFTDSSFGVLEPSTNLNLLLGGQLAYRLDTKFPIRILASVMTDATLDDRQVIMANLGFQMGWNLFSLREEKESRPRQVPPPPKKEVSPAPLTVPPPAPVLKPEVEKKKTASGRPLERDEILVGFETDLVFFKVGSSELQPKAVENLKIIGRYLATDPHRFESLKILGHTDRTGPYDLNLSLSEQRAQSVEKVMLSMGIPKSKMESIGMGFSQPKSMGSRPEDHRKNRRVELIFTKLQSSAALRKILEETKMKSAEFVEGE